MKNAAFAQVKAPLKKEDLGTRLSCFGCLLVSRVRTRRNYR